MDETVTGARASVSFSMRVVLRIRERPSSRSSTDRTDARAVPPHTFVVLSHFYNHKQKWRLLCLVRMRFAFVDVFALNYRVGRLKRRPHSQASVYTNSCDTIQSDCIQHILSSASHTHTRYVFLRFLLFYLLKIVYVCFVIYGTHLPPETRR